MLQVRLLAGSPPRKTLYQRHVNFPVVSHVLSATGPPQNKGLSPGLTDVKFRDCQLKYVKGVSSVIHLSYVKPVTNVKLAAQNLPVGARLQNFWKTWLDLGAESCSNPERGLCPPLSDLAKTHKVSRGHKLVCQSPQEQLPAGGITSAYGQKCCRTGKSSNISGVFQPPFFSPKAQQQVETYTRFKQIESFPQGGEIQNGDTGNHQNVSPTGGVGYLNRFQGRLLPYPHTRTIQEIPEIPCPGSDIPIQGTALWSVHNPVGVHCNSKRGKTDGHTQGYKNPPVPRRLVGEGQILSGLPPTHPSPSGHMPKFRLAGEFGQVGTGSQADLRFCRLPV